MNIEETINNIPHLEKVMLCLAMLPDGEYCEFLSQIDSDWQFYKTEAFKLRIIRINDE